MTSKYFAPSLTVFNTDGSLDKEGQTQLWDSMITAGIDGILILGSNGEFHAMSQEKKKELIDLASSELGEKTNWIVGTGENSVLDTIEMTNYATKAGATASMVITPYYFGHSAAELIRFFHEIEEDTEGDIYLYNFPARAGNDLTGDIISQICRDHPRIVGVKDTVSEMSHTRDIAEKVLPEFPNFKIFSGMDENLVHNALIGGVGCIAAMANIFPEECVAFTKAVNEWDIEQIKKSQAFFNVASELYTIQPFFVPILKKILVDRGMISSYYCRSVPAQISDAEQQAIDAILQATDNRHTATKGS